MPLETDLSSEIEQLLVGILEIQQELAVIYRTKREAVRSALVAQIDRLTEREERLVTDLRARLRHREQILQRARLSGGPVASLQALIESFAEPARGHLLALVDETRRAIEINRRESWVLWIVSKQSLRLFRDLLDMIANGGRKAPVYFAGPGTEMTFGGSILDASA